MTNKEELVCKNCGYSSEINPDGRCWSSVCKGEYVNKFENLDKEELRKELTNLIDSEIARAKLPRGVNIKDGGRIMCEQIFINKLYKYIEQIRKSDMERVVEEIEKLDIYEDQSPNFIRDEILSIIKQDEK